MKASFAASVLLMCLSAPALAVDGPEEKDLVAEVACTWPGGMPGPTPASDPDIDTLAEFLLWADAMLLAGESLPVDLLLRMALLTPADRLMGIAHLRRSGLLRGDAMPLEMLLAPEPGGKP